MKKRIFCLLLILILSLASCSKGESADTSGDDSTTSSAENVTQGEADIPTDGDFDTGYIEGSDIDVNYSNIDLLIACHTNAGINVKEIQGNVGGELVAKLSSLAQSGEKSKKISDEPFSFQHSDKCYAPVDTFWIKTTDGIYRIMPDGEVSKCADYYAEGDTLEVDDGFFGYINDLWKYYPRNTLICTYDGNEVTSRRVFDGDSEVKIELVSINLSSDASVDNTANEITVKISSKTDKNVIVEAVPQNESNEFANVQAQDVQLKANTPSTLTLKFGGWKNEAYVVNVIVDDARLCVEIKL